MLLNKNRVRRSKGLKTGHEPNDLLPEMPEPHAAPVADAKTIRAGRMAEREAIFQTLEEYGLIERTRGGMPYAPKSEIIL